MLTGWGGMMGGEGGGTGWLFANCVTFTTAGVLLFPTLG